MKKHLVYILHFSLFISQLLTSCQSHTKDHQEVEQTLKNLKDGEADVSIYLGDELFYPTKPVFIGNLTLAENSLQLNIKSRFGDHIMISLTDGAALKNKPYRLVIHENVPTSNSVMLGRLADKEKRTGEGFLMNEGDAIITAISRDKFVIHLNGIAGKYMETDRSKWKKVEGTIIVRKPSIQAYALNEALFFY
jgi:selenophosphate synthetase-related protein